MTKKFDLLFFVVLDFVLVWRNRKDLKNMEKINQAETGKISGKENLEKENGWELEYEQKQNWNNVGWWKNKIKAENFTEWEWDQVWMDIWHGSQRRCQKHVQVR